MDRKIETFKRCLVMKKKTDAVTLLVL